jgi:hypothetical protein
VVIDIGPAVYENPVLRPQRPDQEAAPDIIVEHAGRNGVPAKIFDRTGRIDLSYSILESRPGRDERHHNRKNQPD